MFLLGLFFSGITSWKALTLWQNLGDRAGIAVASSLVFFFPENLEVDTNDQSTFQSSDSMTRW